MAMGFARDLSERFLGFYDVKAIRTARETNHQKAMRSPFPRRKGGRGDRSCEKDRHGGLSLRMMAAGRAKDIAEWER